MNRIIFLLFPLFTLVVSGQTTTNQLSNNGEFISKYSQLSTRQLLDTADYYYFKNSFDTALILYSLIINSPVKNNSLEQQTNIVEAYNKSAVIYYYYMNDFRNSYDLLIKALILCEKINDVEHIAKININIGNIYFHFSKLDVAKWYYSKALSLTPDSTTTVILISNLGSIEMEIGNTDSAAMYYEKSLQISKRNNDYFLSGIMTNIAMLHQKIKQYDSAYYYYQLALEEARKNGEIEYETETLSELSKLYFEMNQTDSALHYINISNKMAEEINFLRIMAENYLTLSKIEESKGHIGKAFTHYKKYVDLKYSIFNTNTFGDINQLQRLYEVTKTNQQIEQLMIEQQIKERTIHYQTIIWLITLFILLLVSIGLLFIYMQNRKLNKAYQVLFEKNLEIIDFQDNSSEATLKKFKKTALSNDIQNELIDKILILMEDTSVICDPKFSIDRLAELVQSNQNYVSQVINNALKKNFRSFLNSYRIREAQRLFSDVDAQKYTIESITLQVGFKSSSAFYDAFKEITGVTPKFYIKSMQERSAALVDNS